MVTPTVAGAISLEDGFAFERERIGTQLTFDKVSIDVPLAGGGTKRILDSVTGCFGPSQLIAVMGPSGSGKTTMLNCLTGLVRPAEGTITLNGHKYTNSLAQQYAVLVPQDDMLTPCLTAEEALLEATQLKTNLSKEEAGLVVVKLLTQFGLIECRNVLIGHPEGRKGLSGGQKKRLSVACELVNQPSLLFLDEPTSGLDAVSAFDLISLLAGLAKDGTTIITTIHQPSAKALFEFDKLMLLAGGKVCYNGTVPECIPFFAKGTTHYAVLYTVRC
jgi:ABC-type multidrug transport system ATPase subunit